MPDRSLLPTAGRALHEQLRDVSGLPLDPAL